MTVYSPRDGTTVTTPLYFSLPDTATGNPVTVIYLNADKKEYELARRDVAATRRNVLRLRTLTIFLAMGWGIVATLFFLHWKELTWPWLFGGFIASSLLLGTVVDLGRALHDKADASAKFQALILQGYLRDKGFVVSSDFSLKELFKHVGGKVVSENPNKAKRFFADPRIIGVDKRHRSRFHENAYREVSDVLSMQSLSILMDVASECFGWNAENALMAWGREALDNNQKLTNDLAPQLRQLRRP